MMDPDSASLTWTVLFDCGDSIFAREDVGEKKKKMDIRVEETAKDRWYFISAFNYCVN